MSKTSHLLDSFIAKVEALSRACGVLAALCLASACLAVCHMVLVRYAFGLATIWQTEFVTFAVVAATLIGSPYVLLTRGHVTVDLLPHYLSEVPKRWLALAASICAWGACAVLTWTGWTYFHEAWTYEWVTESVWGPPLWIPLLPLPVGLGILTLQYTADILCLISGRPLGSGRPKTEAV
ncbi:MAG: TRAP transporter permease DctQ [Rhodospirillaceae bacterium]|nr:TRAP transporter permease DctQ [Rhodospirillaceae bacterium]